MKKTKMINSDISRVISKLGHTDEITIGDSGLPIPDEVERIDLAYEIGKPDFISVLKSIVSEQYVEKVILANEIKNENNKMHKKILNLLEKLEEEQNNEIEIIYISHEEFKDRTFNSKAVVRTGENTPYSNIILSSGVVF